jgi:hypothetical protein
MKTFVIYPSADAGWELLREGDARTRHFADRDAAVRQGHALADAERPSALKVETPHGQVEAVWLFEREEFAPSLAASGC